MSNNKPRICIGIATAGDIKAETVMSLMNMIVGCGLPFMLSIRQGCYVHENRENIVKDALAQNCTHVLFVDSDMKFPADTLNRLLKHGKDIVGAHYYGREMPRKSLCKVWKDENLVPLDAVPDTLFKCAAIPTGMMLIDCNVFKRVDFPRFFFELSHERQEILLGEDVYFCLKAGEKGCKVWCDPTINVKHIGTYDY